MIHEPRLPDLRDELLAMVDADMQLRDDLIARGELFGGYHPEMAAVHERNGERLRSIIANHGWPGRTLVGEDGASAAWLVLQHAMVIPDLQRDAVKLLETSVASGEADPSDYARLVDRVRFAEGRPQLYGTNFDWDEAGALSPTPIEAAASVDERRGSVGLGSIAEATNAMRSRAEAEGDRPPPDWQDHQHAGDEFFRSLGWRG